MFIKQSDDLQLIEENTEKSKAKLYNKYHNVIKGFLYSKLFNKELVEEFTHDVLVKVFVNLDKYNRNLPFNTWVHQITKNFLIDYYKKTNTQKYKREQDFYHIGEPVMSHTNQDYYEMEIEDKKQSISYDIKDYYNHVINYLDTINKKDAEIFKLKFMEGYTMEQLSIKYKMNKYHLSKKIGNIKNDIKNLMLNE